MDWNSVGRGESGARVFRSADGTRYMKVVAARAAAELLAERDRLSWAHERGIPSPAVLDWGTTADGDTYLVTRTVPGVPADRLTSSGIRAAWPSIVAAVRALHAVPVVDCPYRRDVDTMLSLARAVVAAGAVDREFLRDEDRDVPPAALLQRVEREAGLRRTEESVDAVVCHGDLCLPNILVADGRFSGFIDLGRLGVADRHADLALLLTSTVDTFPGFPAAQGYPAEVDDDRVRFYLALDPLTWG